MMCEIVNLVPKNQSKRQNKKEIAKFLGSNYIFGFYLNNLVIIVSFFVFRFLSDSDANKKPVLVE